MTSRYGQRTLVESYDDMDRSCDGIVKNIEKVPWKDGIYSRQSWSNWLHKMAPYAGRMKPAIAHWLIIFSAKEDDLILDPFCGIGTIPLESNLLKRDSIGVDLNPYAYVVARAKMDRNPMKVHIDWLREVELDPENVNLSEHVPKWVLEYYNEQTLKEMIDLRDRIRIENRHFLLGCFIGIAQGHRVGHLSKPSALTLPFRPRADSPGEYKEVIPRLIAKVRRTYRDGFPMEPCGKIYNVDTTELPLDTDSVDVVISSPPYFDTVDYISSNRLRLALLGWHGERLEKLRGSLIQTHKSYVKRMAEVFVEIKRVLKPGGKCILVLGDTHTRKTPINTAQVVKEKILDKMGFKTHGIVPDKIPYRKSVQRTPHSRGSKTSRLDRIMVVEYA